MSTEFKVGDKVRIIADRVFLGVPIDKEEVVEVTEIYPKDHPIYPEYNLEVEVYFPGALIEWVTLLFKESEVERCE